MKENLTSGIALVIMGIVAFFLSDSLSNLADVMIVLSIFLFSMGLLYSILGFIGMIYKIFNKNRAL